MHGTQCSYNNNFDKEFNGQCSCKGERKVLAVTLGYNSAAPEFEVGGKRHRIAHGREGAVLVEVRGGCRFGILCTFGVAMVDVLAGYDRTSTSSAGRR
jgi:hypothetical protein